MDDGGVRGEDGDGGRVNDLMKKCVTLPRQKLFMSYDTRRKVNGNPYLSE